MVRNKRSAATVLGILGGGQLARMLAEAAKDLGIASVVYLRSSDEPAAAVSQHSIIGPISAENAQLQRFLGLATTVAFENEFLDMKVLEKTSQATGRNALRQFVPGLVAMSLVQDKLKQKKLMAELNLPTTRFEAYPRSVMGNDSQKVGHWVNGLLTRFPSGAVIKWARNGYDGRGNFFLREASQFKAASDFAVEAVARGTDVYAEELINFQCEVAMVSCHSVRGEFAHYPLVVSKQTNGVCKLVTGPAVALGVDKRLNLQAIEFSRALGKRLPLHGSFAIEFFVSKKGELLVNEIAPRVHNTGHYTLTAAKTSQFENHIRAVLGLPLGPVDTSPAFAMLNLLGPDGVSKSVNRPLSAYWEDGVEGYWYDKKDIKPGRKMGHLNIAVSKPSQLDEAVKVLERSEKRWVESLQ